MSFTKVLIANRGEIAVRIIRACRKLNLQSVAVYSDADENALHVELADEAVHIGASEGRASYLDIDKIIAVAKQTQAGAIHPGYGFLSENAVFAQRCADEGIAFVGPSPEAIASMGAKIEAKRIAEEAGVHCVPGYHGDDQSDECLLAEAKRIGTPLLIKASAGGGGRGMRRIDDLDNFVASLALARDEAKAAFGDPAVLLEKYVEAPRHIEVQILADKQGNVRHLFERDCSVQRNYQKVIEEAPAPNLSAVLRTQILDDAIKLAEAIGYDNAGTVEFVVDASSEVAYFLEMNTRLQVEHPVTEMVTGIDLAEWQLRVASGEAITFTQDEVQIRGHAVEARVAAENPAEGYRPETGSITAYQMPEQDGLRIDSGIRQGSDITAYYDSMLAKVIAWGGSRDEAIRRLRHALASYQLSGVSVNTGFLHDVLDIPAFQSGEHLTGVLADTWPQGWSPPEVTDRDLAHAALAWHIQIENRGQSNVWQGQGAWRLGENIGRRGSTTWYLQSGNDALKPLQIVGRAGSYVLQSGRDVVLTVDRASYQNGVLIYLENGQRSQVEVMSGQKSVSLQKAATTIDISVRLAEDVLLGEGQESASGGNQVLAPTPGLIAEVLVKAGDTVAAGQPVVVLEAMKLFQELRSPVDAIVGQVHCSSGDSVNGGDVLISFECNEEEAKAVNQ